MYNYMKLIVIKATLKNFFICCYKLSNKRLQEILSFIIFFHPLFFLNKNKKFSKISSSTSYTVRDRNFIINLLIFYLFSVLSLKN